MLSRLFNKAEPDDSGSADLLAECMDAVAKDVRARFEMQYGWAVDESHKDLESLIMSKFLMDQALVSTFCDRIPKKRLRNLVLMLDMIFESKTAKLGSGAEPVELQVKLREYSKMLHANPAPLCWQLVAGSALGLDLVEEKPSKERFPALLPELFIKARDRLLEIIR
jgi:hypothetical protein